MSRGGVGDGGGGLGGLGWRGGEGGKLHDKTVFGFRVSGLRFPLALPRPTKPSSYKAGFGV